MKVELKTWTGLGVATALAGLSLSGCGGEAGGEAGEGGEAAQVGEAGVAGEGEGGEGGEGEGGEGTGGEGGEGGVDVSAASSDPVVYASALAVAEAHVLAGRDAYAAGETEAGAEMFAHPVSEVLLELDPVFNERGVDDFKPLFSQTSEAALAGASADDIAKRTDAIIAALRAAEANAPDSGASEGAVAGGVVAEMIERAVAMYARANEGTAYGPYLDGYGFYMAAKNGFERSGDAIRSENADLASRIEAALGLLGEAYPGVERPAKLDVAQGKLSGASASVLLAAS
jgi:hypothetical protein